MFFTVLWKTLWGKLKTCEERRLFLGSVIPSFKKAQRSRIFLMMSSAVALILLSFWIFFSICCSA